MEEKKYEIKSKPYYYGVDRQFPKKMAAEQFIMDMKESIIEDCLRDIDCVQCGEAYIAGEASALRLVIPVKSTK